MSVGLAQDAATHEAFVRLKAQPRDGLLALIGLHAADLRPNTIDVGVGVYRDDKGHTPVMRAVKGAEACLLREQATKSYLGVEGDAYFVDLLAPVVLGETLAASGRISGVQTPGGTGALRLGAELLALARPDATVWIGTPTWPNHAPIFAEAGLRTALHPYFDPASSSVDFDGMLAALDRAVPGDVMLLHGCCHNPTGTGFPPGQWHAIVQLILAKGLVPFVDLAYQGLGDGLSGDALGTRRLLADVPAALVAYSCDKNFGLYRERVGALWVQASGTSAQAIARDNVMSLARSLWSMPPDHGAAIVRIILGDPALRADWQRELEVMRQRINQLRHALAATHDRLSPIGQQRGMFAMLPLDGAAVTTLRKEHGIYMAESGRINIAGLRDDTIPAFAAALAPFLNSGR